MKKFIFAILFLSLASVAYAQPATSGNKIGWDQSAPSLLEAQEYTYRYYADANTTGVILLKVVCTGTVSPYQCEVAFPAFTPGNHTLTLTTANIAGESVKSLPLSFVFTVTPSAPANVRIK